MKLVGDMLILRSRGGVKVSIRGSALGDVNFELCLRSVVPAGYQSERQNESWNWPGETELLSKQDSMRPKVSD